MFISCGCCFLCDVFVLFYILTVGQLNKPARLVQVDFQEIGNFKLVYLYLLYLILAVFHYTSFGCFKKIVYIYIFILHNYVILFYNTISMFQSSGNGWIAGFKELTELTHNS